MTRLEMEAWKVGAGFHEWRRAVCKQFLSHYELVFHCWILNINAPKVFYVIRQEFTEDRVRTLIFLIA